MAGRARKARSARSAGGGKRPRLGTGARFRSLAKQLRKKGARSPKALAAWIGRKKYGARRMAKMAAAGRRRK